MSEAMLFNNRQGVVLDDIARFWKADKHDEGMPCIFFVDVRGINFYISYPKSHEGRKERDIQFNELMRSI